MTIDDLLNDSLFKEMMNEMPVFWIDAKNGILSIACNENFYIAEPDREDGRWAEYKIFVRWNTKSIYVYQELKSAFVGEDWKREKKFNMKQDTPREVSMYVKELFEHRAKTIRGEFIRYKDRYRMRGLISGKKFGF